MKGEGWTVQSKEQTTTITNPESNQQAPPVQWKGRARSLAEQGAWQSKELGRARSLAIVEQGRFPHWRHLLGFATPLTPEHRN